MQLYLTEKNFYRVKTQQSSTAADGKAVAFDFARFGDERKSVGVAVLNDFLYYVDLFFADDADKNFVVVARIVSDAFHNGYAAVHLVGNLFGDFFVFVGYDVEHQRRLHTGLYDVGNLRRCEQRKEGVKHRRQNGCYDCVGTCVHVKSDKAEAAGGNDDYAVAHEDEPLNVGYGVLCVDEFTDDVSSAERSVVTEHKTEAYTCAGAACKRGEQHISAFGV